MINPERGEAGLKVAGETLKMRLTLGALAALEARLEADGLAALADRFEAGAFRAGDIVALLTAGLNGAGREMEEAEVAALPFDGGAIGAAEAAARLLAASFRGVSA